jgi:hypothetical protein
LGPITFQLPENKKVLSHAGLLGMGFFFGRRTQSRSLEMKESGKKGKRKKGKKKTE